MIALDFEKNKALIEREFAAPVWDAESGLEPDALRAGCRALWENERDVSIALRRAHLIAYVLDHAQVSARPFEYFADQLRHDGIPMEITRAFCRSLRPALEDVLAKSSAAVHCRALTGEGDFGHTCPDWRALLTLGYPGILARLRNARALNRAPEQAQFYDAGICVYEALLRLLSRLAEAARRCGGGIHGSVMAENLRALSVRAPQTFHEALQLSTLTLWLQSGVEGAVVRSLGRFDLLYQPFFERDLRSGRFSEAELLELLRYYLYRWNAANIEANVPLTMGGTAQGEPDAFSDFAHTVFSVYGELSIISPKIHLRCTADTPEAILSQPLDLIRKGTNSIVLCNDEVVVPSLMRLGETREDACDYVMVGCYESTSMGREVACTCNGRISFPKAVEYAMTGGADMLTGEQVGLQTPAVFDTFEDFFGCVCDQLRFFADQCMERVSAIERQYVQLYSAPLFSSTLASCVESGRDVYAGGAKYNHSSINAFGLATAVDALAAIDRLVFTDPVLSLQELAATLRSNWEGQEMLRRICQRRMPKYGNHHPAADALAAKLMHAVAAQINGKPNGRNGVFRTGSFSIDWRFDFGKHTAASADGRYAGETLSKNTSASLGMDRAGATALIQSATCIDYTELPNGAVLDLMLHGSAVSGQEGMEAMLGLLRTFLSRGGMALQLNILDAATLRDAQREPLKYANLQVRLCGWNVLFVNLSKKEQDELILQAQAQA